MQTKRIGDIEISAIAEYAGPYRDPLEMFPDATQELVDHHRGWLEPGCIDPESGTLNSWISQLSLPIKSSLIEAG